MIHFRFGYYSLTLFSCLAAFLGSFIFYKIHKNKVHKEFLFFQASMTIIVFSWVVHTYYDIVHTPGLYPIKEYHILLENIGMNLLVWSFPLFVFKLFKVDRYRFFAEKILPSISILMQICFTLYVLRFFDLDFVSPVNYYRGAYTLFLGVLLATFIIINFFAEKRKRSLPFKVISTLTVLIIPLSIIDVLFSFYERFILLAPLLVILFNIFVLKFGIKNIDILSKKIRENDLNKIAKENQLTTRETEILSYLKEGHTYNRISDELFISTATVKTHINRIYKKMGVTSKQELKDLILEKCSGLAEK